MFSLRTTAQAFLLALVTSSTPAVNATWECANDGTGLTPEQLGTIKLTFDLAFGTDPVTVDAGAKKAVTCNGLTFGIVNGVGYSDSETDTSRTDATSENTNGSGVCLWEINAALSYSAGNEGDITWCPAVGCELTEHTTC